jgi:hypothetical protein
MKRFVQIFVVALIAELVFAGGDDACDGSYLPYNKSDILTKNQQIRSYFAWVIF